VDWRNVGSGWINNNDGWNRDVWGVDENAL